MSLSRSRTITILVAFVTLISNTCSSLLFHQLPDDPYHLSSTFGWYLHFTNLLSIFGLVGALRQHPLSVTIFSFYLLLDTILCSVPRLMLLTLLQPFASDVCSSPSPPNSPPYKPASTYTISPSIFTFFSSPQPTGYNSEFAPLKASQAWSITGCESTLHMVGLASAAGVIAATVLQLVGALAVREYARRLYIREEQESVEMVSDISQAENGTWKHHAGKTSPLHKVSTKHQKSERIADDDGCS